MKIIVTHTSPDWDAIGSIWLLKKYISDWQDAKVEFVPAGQRYKNQELRIRNEETVIEDYGEDDVIHVDTGLGPLDHHQTSDTNVSGTGRTWDYVQEYIEKSAAQITAEHKEAVSRIVKIIVDTDHFKEVFWENAAADYHEFSLLGVLEGLQYAKPGQNNYYVEFGIECLNALLHTFENRIWAEKEIRENGVEFATKWGKGIGFETLNDTVMKLAQKMGFTLVVRKDPRKGYVRIKGMPSRQIANGKGQMGERDVDLSLVYEQLKKMDPDATWYLHVSKKMLLNGTPKNPKMVPTKLTLQQVIEVLKRV